MAKNSRREQGLANIIKRHTGREVATALDDDVQALREYVAIVAQIAQRLERERTKSVDSRELASRDKIEETPT